MAKVNQLLVDYNHEGFIINLFEIKQGNIINLYGNIQKTSAASNETGNYGPIPLDFDDIHISVPVSFFACYGSTTSTNHLILTVDTNGVLSFKINTANLSNSNRFFNVTFISQRNH